MLKGEKNLKKFAKISQNNEYLLLIVTILLVSIGLVFVYSASFYTAEVEAGNKYYYLIKQGVGALVGMVALVSASLIDVNLFKKFHLPLAIVSLIFLALVFVPGLGISKYGATRWIGFGGFSFQPSEICKFALVLVGAHSFGDEKVKKTFFKYAKVIFFGLAYCVLIILEPNMSVTVCVGLLLLALLFLGGMKIKTFLLFLLPFAIALPLLIVLEPYRMLRLMAFLDPWASPKNEGYQLIQSLYALGSGGLFGVGLFCGRQKYRFLPFAESDFVFSVIGEETGLFGCLFVFLLFALYVYCGVKIAVNAKDKFCSLLAGGITSVVAIQSLINFAVVTGSIPPTGLPLPFISYGGTSLVVFMTATGILLGISRKNNINNFDIL